MERSKIVTIKGESYKLNIPTMRTSIIIQSQVANVTRGTHSLMSISSNAASQQAALDAVNLSRLDALVTKQKSINNVLQDDFSFSFFDLDEVEGPSIIDAVSKELDSFIEQFRKQPSA